VGRDPSTATESVYIVRGEVSPEAITASLQALLPTKHHPILRHRFTLLDTFDGRVRRAGARLTAAGVNGSSTVAWQAAGGGHLSVRLRQPVSFVWDLPDGPLQRALGPVIGVRRLLPQADVEEHGSLLEILDDRSKIVARVRIGSGRARLARLTTSRAARSDWRPLPTMITLTGLRGYEDAYHRLVPLIESRPGVESCPEGLHGVTLREVGAPERRDAWSPLDLAPTVRAGVGARQIHLALLGILMSNEAGLRANLDSEFLHDVRVAVRRTRALLGQIKRVFPPAIVEHFSTEFSWFSHLTGPPRDMDVLVLSLREPRPGIAAADMDALKALLALLKQTQQHEHQRLVEALDSERYRRLILEWKTFLEQPTRSELEAANAGRLLADVVASRAWRLSRRIADSAQTIDERSGAERLHEVRINAKKLRYLVDVTPAFYDPADLECILGALKRLQRVLGDFNDAQVQEKRLLDYGRALSATGGAAGALLALGRLAEDSRQRGGLLRGKVFDGLARFRAHETRSACRRAFKRSGPAEHVR
jgi:CHAD domain-containing protein